MRSRLMNLLIPFMLTVSSSVHAAAKSAVQDGADLLRRFSATDQWFLTEQDGRKYYEAILHDLDGDGDIDCIFADTDNHYSDGCGWEAIQNRGKEEPFHALDTTRFEFVDVYARPERFYLLGSLPMSPQLVVDGAHIYESEKLSGKRNSQVVCSARLKMTPDGCLLYDRLPNGLGYELFSGAAERIERAYSCFYYGSELKPRSMAPECSFEPLRKGAAFEDGMYRLMKEILRTTPSVTNAVDDCCHVVYLDADNDGDTDCYVARGRGTAELDWKLYLNEQGDFRRAEKTIWHNKARRYGFTAIEPEVRAATNAFYRAVFRDGEPAVLVVGKDETGFYSQSERRYRDKFGEGEIMDLGWTIRHPCFHGIERLPCRAYAAP